jgi:DNA processing protein
MNRRALAWLALNHIPGAGAVTLLRLASRFGSPEAVLDASMHDLVAVGSLSPEQAHRLAGTAADLSVMERLAERLQCVGITLLTVDDEAYPRNLRALRDAPPLLYVRGALVPSDDAAVAIVGTRTPSEAGSAAARVIAEALASKGITVVSGLALGIDAAAHRGALDGKRRADADEQADGTRGRTIAVLGSGIDRVTPRRHCGLAEQVAESGAVLSESPPGTPASREALLARNRIQAGLAKAVIVAQCRSRGGSCTTAWRAFGAGRPVFAIAWDEPEFSAGTRRLEAMGGRAVGVDEATELAAVAASAALPPADQPELAVDDYSARGE